MSCRICTAPPVYLTPADRRCAFDDEGLFRSDNWGCGAMAALRGLALLAHTVEDPAAPLVDGSDHHFVRMAPIAHDGRFVLLFWRGNSGAVDQAVVVRAGAAFYLDPLRLGLAEEVIAARTRRSS